MKLNESQSESFQLLYASVCNGLLYAEDLIRYKDLREPVSALVTKLRWMKSALELRIPEDKRRIAQKQDHLFFDELLRCASHMGKEDRSKLENFINQL
jgi:hypothetical protein